MSERLYYQDAYIKDFTASVIDCFEYNCNYAVVLDRTAFFPCGGGQYGDVGYINGTKVIDTIEKDGIIYHITVKPIDLSIDVQCSINWQLRYKRMQNHSGEHILSGIIFSKFGFNNVGFHLGDDDVTLDCDGKLSDEDIEFIENEANTVIDENKEIKIYYPDSVELEKMPYRSKLDLTENVRIVEICGVDKCACCAPHLHSTAEIGLIKIIKHYNYKGGTRLHIKCGSLARADYKLINYQINEIANNSSVKREEVLSAFDRLNREISALKSSLQKITEREIEYLSDNPYTVNGINLFITDFYSNTEMTLLLNKSLSKHNSTSCVFSKTDNGYTYIIGGEKSQAVFNILKEIGAKGGGKEFIQGRVECEIDDVFSKIKEII